MGDTEKQSCCFFGHKNIIDSEELNLRLREKIENLIVKRGVRIFLFGSNSEFNTACHKAVTELKEKYTEIERVYVRAEFPYIDSGYTKYLLKNYEQTYFPPKILGAGKAAYVERNYEMIDKSRYCICYCDTENNFTALQNSEKQKNAPHAKSGSVIALNYALKRKREIINLFK